MANKHGQYSVRPLPHIEKFIENEYSTRKITYTDIMNEIMDAGWVAINKERMASSPDFGD